MIDLFIGKVDSFSLMMWKISNIKVYQPEILTNSRWININVNSD